MVDLSCRNLTSLDWNLVKLDDTQDSVVASDAKTVDLKENRLQKLPNQFGTIFRNTRILVLRKNQLENFPPDISRMVCLRELYLDFNRLVALPRDLFELPLVTLSATQNQLKTLAPEIGKCKTLQNLFVADNVIASLPSEIGMCTNLSVFHLHNNSLIHLPTSLHLLKHIVEWSLEWLRYSTPPLPRVLKGSEWQKQIRSLIGFLEDKSRMGREKVSCMEMLSAFSQKTFDINGFDSKKRTRLHVTSLEGHAGVANALIEGGAKLDMLDCEGYSPLLIAVREEHALIVNALVAQKANVNIGGGLFGSPLHVCTVNFDVSLAASLIAGKADVNFPDSDGNTPLHVLMSVFNKGGRKSFQVGELLLEAKADCNVLNSDLWAPLHLAARRGQSSGVAFVIKNIEQRPECSRGTCTHSRANSRRTLTCTRAFDVNLRGGSHHWGSLHLAGHACHAHAVETLIDAGCDVFLKNADNRTARHVSRGNMSLAKLIRKAEEEWFWYRVHWRRKPLNDSNLETPNKEREQRIVESCLSNHLSDGEIDALESVVFRKPLEETEFLALISNFISTHQNHRLTFLLSSRKWARELAATGTDANGMNILMYACEALNHDIIRYIFGIFSPADVARLVAQVDDNENSVLHLLCSETRTKSIGGANRASICEFLLLCEGVIAYLNARDIRGHTPLHRAASLADFRMVQVLLTFDADPNVRETTAGWTPLHLAIGDYTMMLVLLNDDRTLPSLCDNFEWPPLLEAANKLDAKAVGLLVNAGAQKHVDILKALDSAKKDLSGKRWMLSLLAFNGFSMEGSEVILHPEDTAAFEQEKVRPPPRGAPTRFFVPEHLAPRCFNCKVLFSVTVRRHWCRSCGTVQCGSCIATVNTSMLPLDLRHRESNATDLGEINFSATRLSKAIESHFGNLAVASAKLHTPVGSEERLTPRGTLVKIQSYSFCGSCSDQFVS